MMGGSADDDASEEPPECRPTAVGAVATGLGAFGSGLNGGPNTALEIQEERCRQAREAQRFNAEHRARAAEQAAELDLERQRLELERQRVELEQRRLEVEAEEQRARAAGSQRPPPGPDGAAGSTVLLIFGGPGHKTFFGCLCADTDENSVFNDGGKHGRNGLNLDNSTLWGPLSIYRSPFGDYSACAMFAKDPPIVVTPQGQAICRLTTDQTNQYQCKEEKLIDWLKHGPCGL
jgi:hypothetical protein